MTGRLKAAPAYVDSKTFEPPSAEEDDRGHQTDREPARAGIGGCAGHSPPVRADQRPLAAGAALRVRACAVRRVLGPGRWRGDAFVRDAAVARGRQVGHHTRRSPSLARAAAEARDGSRAPPNPAGGHRRAGAAVRLLLQRPDDQGGGAAVEEREADRRGDSHGDERTYLPLRDVSTPDESDQARRARHGGRWAMS